MFRWFGKAQNIYCRTCVSGDAGAMVKLHAQGFERPWGASEFEALLSDKSVIGHIALGRFQKPAGFILSRIAADEAEILSVAVATAARRQGVAKQLLAQNIASLAQNKIAALFLEVDELNTPAIHLYRQFGFETVGKRESYYKRKDGSSPAALVMKRLLV